MLLRASLVLFVLVAITSGRSLGKDVIGDVTQNLKADDSEIASLIDQLGHAEFRVRESAQQKLSDLGIACFDSLIEAQYRDDIEVGTRARYLVRSAKIEWSSEDSPPEVAELLQGYSKQSDAVRLARIESLGDLGAIAELCRIAQFDPSDAISKHAALAIMRRQYGNETNPSDEAEQAKASLLILASIKSSRRLSAEWLRHYASEEDPVEKARDFGPIIDAEIELLTTRPERTSRPLAVEFSKWHVDHLQELDLNDEAKQAMHRVANTHDVSTPFQLTRLTDWLIDREGFELVVQQSQRYAKTFERDTLLLYRAAESYAKLGQQDKADEVATKAFSKPPKRAFGASGYFVDSHANRGIFLEDRGLIPWCRREYRKAIDDAAPNDYEGYYVSFRLSELLHDSNEQKAAADLLADVLKAMDKDRSVRRLIEQLLKRPAKSIRSRMNYFEALQLVLDGKPEESREKLEKGYASDPSDPDVLIAMHRSPEAPVEWKEKTETRIEKSAKLIENRIKRFERLSNNERTDDTDRELANAFNHYAWLVSNTKGDYERALYCSKKSLELVPDSPELTDTLARCYFALKDYENAVKFQREAAKELPHSGQIGRQLELFEKTYAESKNSK